MSGTKIRIHVVDDDEAIQQSIGFMLRKTGHRVATFSTGGEFLGAVNRTTRGCVLLDFRMPGMDGLEVQRRMSENGIMLPVVMLTGRGDISLVVRAVKAGAVEFLEKPFERVSLLAAIEEALGHAERGERGQLATADAVIRLGALTPREREVLDLIAVGRPNKLIAFDLGIATRTVEAHRANMMGKLHTHSLSEVLKIAFTAGVGEAA